MAAPSISGISIASDDPLFGDMLRVAAAGQSDCSWQAPLFSGGGGAARGAGHADERRGGGEDEAAAKRARTEDAAAVVAYRCLDTMHEALCQRCVARTGSCAYKAVSRRPLV
jgi:hypothetical protein